jgi:predicted 3-demethylubiquinone-9 3-methyltransferase (glyoxalase superfamily)
MQKIVTFLMFTGNAEEAINFYISLFKNSGITSLNRYGANQPGTEGTVQKATFTLNEQEFMCIDSNAPHNFSFTPSMSLFVNCANEEEINHLFAELSQGGSIMMPLNAYPFAKKFAWVSDKFGVSWQLAIM